MYVGSMAVCVAKQEELDEISDDDIIVLTEDQPQEVLEVHNIAAQNNSNLK